MHSRATYPYPLGVEPIHPPIPTHPPPNLVFVELDAIRPTMHAHSPPARNPTYLVASICLKIPEHTLKYEYFFDFMDEIFK